MTTLRSSRRPKGGRGSTKAGPPADGGTSEGVTSEGDWKLRPVVRIKALLSKGTCEEADAGTPTEDPCGAVECAETEICENGTCRAAER